MASAQSKAEGDMKIKELEGQMKMQASAIDEQAKSKNTVLTGIMKLYEIQQQTGQPMPPELRALAQVTLETVALPAMIENEETRKAVAEKMQQEAMMAQQQQQPETQEQSSDEEWNKCNKQNNNNQCSQKWPLKIQ
jgi:invasion protein IalB